MVPKEIGIAHISGLARVGRDQRGSLWKAVQVAPLQGRLDSWIPPQWAYGHGPPLPYVGPNTIRRECFMDKKDGHIVETAVEARGGRLGRPVLVVLIISLVALIGIFAVIYYGSFG